MDRSILEKYKKQEDRLLLSKVLDKSKFCLEKNKIETTDFLDLSQKELVSKFLQVCKNEQYIFYGGLENAERTVAIFYPEKLEEIIKENKFDFNTIFSVIRITLPNELKGTYEHRNYLGALMKLGLKREKIGDIIVYEEGADIIVKPEIEEFLITNLNELTRFNKSKIEKIKLNEIKQIEKVKIEEKITVSSMRLDNIVSEIARCSRNKADELLIGERVLVNFETITKASKEIKEKDIITIRGKGRFEIIEILGNSKKRKIIVKIEKFNWQKTTE